MSEIKQNSDNTISNFKLYQLSVKDRENKKINTNLTILNVTWT